MSLPHSSALALGSPACCTAMIFIYFSAELTRSCFAVSTSTQRLNLLLRPPRPPAMHEQKQPSLAVVWDLHFLSPVLEVPMILTVCLCLCPSLLCISLCICVSFFLDGEHRLVVQLWNRGSGWIPVRRIKGAPHGRIWAGNRAESQNQGESRYFAWTHKYISKYTMGRSC